MFDWLFEGWLSVYLLLAGLGVALLVMWWRTRQRSLLVGVGLAMLMAGLYALLDRLVETDREQITRNVVEIIEAVNKRDLDGIFKHVSDQFRSPNGRSKQELRTFAEENLRRGIVEKVVVMDIVCDGTPSRESGTARVFFRVKAVVNREILADCDTTFDFSPQHGWRMRSIRLFVPGTNDEWQIQL